MELIEIWGSLRGLIRDSFTFSQIKELAGASGLPIQRLSHLQQRQLPAKGASKSQLLDAIDDLLNEQNEPNLNVEFFIKEIIRRKSQLYEALEETIQRFGWYLDGETPCRRSSSNIKNKKLFETQFLKNSGDFRMQQSTQNIWNDIRNNFGISKQTFGKKWNFVTDKYKRKIIFRDIEHAYILANYGFSKPATILVGSVIEELLRLYLESKNIKPTKNTFEGYITICEQKKLLKSGIFRLSDSVRHFRNLVHLSEETKKYTISKATAKGAVASIFTIVNDF